MPTAVKREVPEPNPRHPLEQAGHELRKLGWGVLKLPYGQKKTPPDGYTGQNGIMASAADVQCWIDEGPANVGIRMPEDVVGLDFDCYKEVGRLSKARLEDECGPLPETWTSTSRTDGSAIHYFRVPVVPGVRFHDPAEGIEVIQHHHRYAVAPPSLHPDTHRIYVWRAPDGSSTPPNVAELPDLPSRWLEAILRGKPDKEVPVLAPGEAYMSLDSHKQYRVDRWLENTVKAIQEELRAAQSWPDGHRERIGQQLVGWEKLCADKAWRLASLAKAPWNPMTAVQARAVFLTSAPTDSGWTDRDLKTKWRQQFDRAEAAGWPLGEDYDEAEILLTDEPLEGAQPEPEKDESTGPKPLDWHALYQLPENEEWLVYPVLAMRRSTAWYSAPKVGKSLLALEVAVALALGKPVLGCPPQSPMKVLYIDCENDPRGDIRSRLGSMGLNPEDLQPGGPGSPTNLVYFSFPNMQTLDSKLGGEQMMDLVRIYQPDLVIIDTVSRMIAGEENSNDTWLNFYRYTGMRLKRAGIGMLRLDHEGKDTTRGQRGGSAKGGDVDAVWRLSGLPGGQFRLKLDYGRMYLPEADQEVMMRREIGPLRHEVELASRSHQFQVDATVQAMDALKLPYDVSQRAAEEALDGKFTRALIREAVSVRKNRWKADQEVLKLTSESVTRSAPTPSAHPSSNGVRRTTAAQLGALLSEDEETAGQNSD